MDINNTDKPLEVITKFEDQQVPFATSKYAYVVADSERKISVVDTIPDNAVFSYEIPTGTIGKSLDKLIERLLPAINDRYAIESYEDDADKIYEADSKVYDIIDEFWENGINDIAFIVDPDERAREYIDDMTDEELANAVEKKLVSTNNGWLYFPGTFDDYMRIKENKRLQI